MFTLPDDKALQLVLTGQDKKGEPVAFVNPTFTPADANLLVPDANGLVQVGPLTGVTLPIQTQVNITATDPNDSTKTVAAIADVTIVAGALVSLQVGGSIVDAPTP